MNSSGWVGTIGTASLNASNVIYLTATSGDLAIGTTTSNPIRFVIAGGADAVTIDTNSRVGIGVTSPTAALHLEAGTATASTAPLKLTSGTSLTTAEAGALEYDGKTLFITPEASNRGVAPAVHYITLTTGYTTVSGSTALQKMFNSTTNGALTVGGSTTYFFECDFSLSSMSTTSGAFSFGLLGTATYTRVRYWAISKKAAAAQGTGLLTMGTAATATALVANNTTATGHSTIRGKIVVGTGGTIIPAFAISQAAAAVVDADASFRIWAVGSNTVTSVGNWS
jgi:hypothetical protein